MDTYIPYNTGAVIQYHCMAMQASIKTKIVSYLRVNNSGDNASQHWERALANKPILQSRDMERHTRFELVTSTLARLRSTN